MSFWWDEAMLADNLVQRGFDEMLDPLDHRQAAPPGFLLAVKGVAATLGTGERTLRVVPMLASVAGLMLFVPLAIQMIGWRWGLAAIALVSFNTHLIGHASELKQYSGDAAITIALLLAASVVWRHGWTTARAVALGVLGAVSVWFSHPAVFVLASIGMGLLLQSLRSADRSDARRILLIGAIWLASFALHYLLHIRLVSTDQNLRKWWGFAFWPVLPYRGEHLVWYRDIPIRMFSYPGGLSFVGLGAASLVVGLLAWWREDKVRLCFVAGPLALALLASALGKYPFFERTLLFATAPMILLMVGGIEYIRRRLHSRVTGVVLAAMLIAGPAYGSVKRLIEPVGKGTADVSGVLLHVSENWREGDALVVHWGLHFTVDYYVRHSDMLPETAHVLPANGPVITMPAEDPGWNELIEQLLPTLRQEHKRVWIIYGNLCPEVPSDRLPGLRVLESYRAPRGAYVKLYEILPRPPVDANREPATTSAPAGMSCD
ncbi:MAG: hypothetical protein ACP5HU_10485 [Phycisphaerae bacterium]